MKKNIWAIVFSACLALFTAYAALDTFVFANVYQENATELNTAMFNDALNEETSVENNSGASSVLPDSTTSQNAQEAQTGQAGSSSSRPSRTPGSAPSRRAGKTHDTSIAAQGAAASDSTARDASETSSATSDASNNAATTATSSTAAASNLVGQHNDENANITVSTYNVSGTTVYVADVTLSSAEYLKTAFANDMYGKNIVATTSQTAAAHNAVLAINGDNYGSRESGYVIRNGVVYRDTLSDSDVLCVYADGTFKVMNAVEASAQSAQDLVDQGVWQAFSFGPALVQDHAIAVSQNDEVGKAMASNPRTAIGILDANHYVLVVSDGRTAESEGLSLYELAQFMQETLGVECAYNLDGGGSSTMVFEGSVINNPTTNGHRIEERNVNDIVYIG